MVSRRSVILGLPAVMALPLITSLTGRALADWVPTKDVELVVPYAPGGGADIVGRLVAQIITEERLSPVNIQIVNKPGGASAVGIGYVASNKANDPETLVVLNTATVLTPLRVADAPGWRNTRPLVNLIGEDYLIFVKGDSPWNSLKDMVAEVKASGQPIVIASGGSSDELAARMVTRSGGIEATIVNVSGGGEAINSVLGGHVQATIGNPIEFLGQVEAGALKALATLGQERYPLLPNVPTTAESGVATPRFEAFRGIGGPAGMPDEAAAYWIGVLEKVAASSRMKEYIEKNAAQQRVLSGDDYKAYIESQELSLKDYL